MGTSEDFRDRLDRYLELVVDWGPRLGLISTGDLPRIRSRHIEDSLRALPLVEAAPTGPCADVGSGAGFPGIPLAIATPDRRWTLIEPRTRRAGFLEQVVRELSLDCDVLPGDAAAAARALGGVHAVVCARALAPPARAFDLIRPLVAAGGIGVVFTGRGAEIPPEAAEWAPGIAIIRRTPQSSPR